jgi:ABC-type antimicrobial peptide transport system permease subunit
VIGSYEGMEALYPNSRLGLFNKSLEEMKLMTDTLFPNKYGRTIWYLKTDSYSVDYVLDARLLTYANEHGYTLYNYKASNAELYHEALNNAVIIGLLGITAAAIACVILYNTTVSKLEQDKNRIGILQALGVTKEQFSNHYLKLGVLTGVISLIITHITLFLVLFLTSIGLTEGLTMSFLDYLTHIFANRLWLYPWYIHIFLCILYLAITVLIYYLPNKKVTALYPVENIRSLGR